jgi:phosphatidate cytidylyltransferase
MLRLRILSFLVGFPFMLIVSYFGGWLLLAVVLFLAYMALYEWRRAIHLTTVRPNFLFAGVVIFLIVLATWVLLPSGGALDEGELSSSLVFLFVFTVCGAFISRVLVPGGTSALADVAVTVLTPLYLGMFAFMWRIRESAWPLPPVHIGSISLSEGCCLLVMFFLICWGMDGCALLFGHLIGGPKLSPTISPGKTMSGLAGALLAAALLTALGFWLIHLPVIHGIWIGLLMGLFGQLGDLSKSLVKREVGLKDFGTLVPGHGGVLDRFDNVLFNAPLFYYLMKWLIA